MKVLLVVAALLAVAVAAPTQDTEPRGGRAAYRIDPAYFKGNLNPGNNRAFKRNLGAPVNRHYSRTFNDALLTVISCS